MGILKKTVKLLTKPTAFIHDSWLFKYNATDEEKKTKNLFVISHLGQLAQVEALIKKEKFLNCVLVVIYTKRNTRMPSIVRENADKSLFNKVLLLQIPSFPNKIHLQNWMLILNSYKRLLRTFNPHRLFILSFERHYCLLAEEARKKGIQVNLIEEGTATYKYNTLYEAKQAQKTGLNGSQKLTRFWILINPLFAELRPALGVFSHFHTVYAAFPEMLKSQFTAKAFKPFFLYENLLHEKPDINLIKQYPISQKDALFLNQRYPFPQDIYAQSLISFLSSYPTQKAFIKLHPKDSEELKQALKKEIEVQKLSEKITLIDEYGFLVEGLIAVTKPKAVLALTSTSLLYTTKISPHSESVSIYPSIRENLIKRIGYNEPTFKESDEHFDILKKFDVVREI